MSTAPKAIRYAVGLLAAVALLIPMLAFAAPVIRSGESVSIEQGQTVEGDFYGFGGVTTISGEVQGDAYVSGGTVTVNASIGADLTVAGGTVQVHAPVADDLRVVGGEVTVADKVDGDVVVLGGVLRVLSTADIKGDVIFYGGELVIEGPVEGSVYGGGKTVRIDASVGGDVDIRADQGLTLGDRAEVLGNITYKGVPDISRSQNAVVVGDIQKEAVDTAGFSFTALIVRMLVGLFAGLVAFLIFRQFCGEIIEEIRLSYGMQGLIGLAIFIGMPFAAIILMISVLGLIVGILLLALYIALLIAAWITAGVAIGTMLMRMMMKKKEVTILSVIIGITVLELISLIPLAGPLLVLAAVLVALGAIGTRIYRMLARR